MRQTELFTLPRHEVFPLSYTCDMGVVDQSQFMPAIKSALGPDWLSEPCLKDDLPSAVRAITPGGINPVCFYHEGKRTMYPTLLIGPNSPTEKIITIAVLNGQWVANSHNTNREDGIGDAITRIETSQHSSLPSMQPGSGSGPITIQNDTSSTLTVYFSGSTNWKEIVPPHSRTFVTLNPGAYKVAGELSDKSVRPFFGGRDYSGGETERFYIAAR